MILNLPTLSSFWLPRFQKAMGTQCTVIKVKHWFSLFHSNSNSTGHPIQLQNKTVHVEWSLMILNLPTLSSFWLPRFQKAMGTQCMVFKVKHWFSLFHSNSNSTGHPIQLQNKTVHVEWSLMILNLPTLSSFWLPRFQKAMGTQCMVIKVKHWFSLFHSNSNSTGHPIQLQNKTVHVEWSLMILNLPTLSSFWLPRFQKAMGTQ